MDDLKAAGLIRGIGISINRWEPWNALETLRTGLIDAVQVVYNIFDQSPEDELLPLCEELNIGVIARAFRRRHFDRNSDKRLFLARRRFSQYLLRTGKSDSKCTSVPSGLSPCFHPA